MYELYCIVNFLSGHFPWQIHLYFDIIYHVFGLCCRLILNELQRIHMGTLELILQLFAPRLHYSGELDCLSISSIKR